MRTSFLLALTGLAVLVPATPIAPPLSHGHPLRARQDNSTSACAQVQQYLEEEATTRIPAKLAHDCLISIPLNATSAKELLQALPTYIEWQSTLDALKNPPSEYAEMVQPPVDILGGLKMIEADIDAGKLESEYEFGWSLYSLILSAHDGHFAYVPDSVGAIFRFGRPIPLVSVSEDGTKLPSIFAFHDVLGMQFKNISYTPSPVVLIDNIPATMFLEKWSQYGGLQDRDALYNNAFYELAQVSLGSSGSGTGLFAGGGRASMVYPDATTKLTFANGTSYTMENYARVLVPFNGVTSGEDLARRYFYFGSSGFSGGAHADADEDGGLVASAQTPLGYPDPVVAGPYNLINGYFIDAPGYEDVAVLSVPNFVGASGLGEDFQMTTQRFIPMALAAGKTKLIVDLQANGGGTIMQGYDMFKQLFPSIEPYGANRFRAHEAIDLIGQSYSAWASKFPRSKSVNYTVTSVQSSYFDYHMDMTLDGEPFSSWDEKFGPYESDGGFYTTPHRWNLSDVHIEYISGDINITGYGSLANASRVEPFKPENIVLLTDGYCASTCTIFSEFMTKQAGIKTIAMGGRSNSDQIQAIGGVKGTNNYPFSYIQSLAQNAVRYSSGDLRANINSTVLVKEYYNDVVFHRAGGGLGVNSRDGLPANETDGPALQFIYEEADCRLYYTPEMTVDATAIWKAAADAQWGSGSCVGGSGYGKRDVQEPTTELTRRRAQVSQASALRTYKEFEKTFDLETECRMHGDGFMAP